jgi:hypothetical protein
LARAEFADALLGVINGHGGNGVEVNGEVMAEIVGNVKVKEERKCKNCGRLTTRERFCCGNCRMHYFTKMETEHRRMSNAEQKERAKQVLEGMVAAAPGRRFVRRI